MVRNKKAVVAFTALAGIVIGLLGTMAYMITDPFSVNQEAIITTGTMSMTFKDKTNGIDATLDFGESITKEFIIENTGSLTVLANINFNELVNTYLSESLKYTLSYATSEGGEYTEILTSHVPRVTNPSEIELASGLEIPGNKTYYYRLTLTLDYLDNIDQTQDLNALFKTKFILEQGTSEDMTVAQKIARLANSSVPTYGTAAVANEGIYKLSDDYGTSYYFRGSAVNNYVKFGTWAEGTAHAGKDMYWRIIRVNGDGTLRLIYDGTEAHENGVASQDRVALTNVAWNLNSSNDAKYIGYMYGGNNGEASTSKAQATTNDTSSNIKSMLEEWYNVNLVAGGYSSSIADVYFCNDRSSEDSGYGLNDTIYAPLARLNSETISLSFKCGSSSDRFTKESTTVNKGNGALDYPVGLITVDELITAGAKWSSNIMSTDDSDSASSQARVSLSCPSSAVKGSTIKCEINVTSDLTINGLSGNFTLSNLSYVDLEALNDFSVYNKSANGFAIGNTTGLSGTFTVAKIELLVEDIGSITLTNLDISDTSFKSYTSSNKTLSISLATSNKEYYLYKGQAYWTMSPYSMNDSAAMFYMTEEGNIINGDVTNTNIGIAPVINLSVSAANSLIGSGTKIDPYRLD